MRSNKNRYGLKRLMAIALAVAMLLTIMPTSAFAKPGPKSNGKSNSVFGWLFQPVASQPSTEPAPAAAPAIVEALEVDDLTVSIDAEEGAFPAGAVVSAQKADFADVQKAVDEADGVSGKVLYAVDITFTKDGEELQPAEGKSVKVSFSAPELKDVADDAAVVHIDSETQEAEKVATVDAADADVAIEAEKFSVYAVLDPNEEGEEARLKVVFHEKDGTEIDTVYVKKSDTLPENADLYPRVLYGPEPEDIDPTAYEMFFGWAIDEDPTDGVYYDETSQTYEINSLRAYVAQMFADETIPESSTLDVYAAVFKCFSVNYLDETGVSVGTDVLKILPDEEYGKYVVNKTYTIEYDDEGNPVHFEGWQVNDGWDNLQDGGSGSPYQNLTTVYLKGDLVLGVYAPVGNWLIYECNDGTYVAPDFIPGGTNTSEPTNDMRKKGYEFTGWYADVACSTPFTFGNTIDRETTVYAGWQENATSPYVVLIWKENTAGDGYDFAESVTLSGTTHTIINTVTSSGTGEEAYAVVNGAAKNGDKYTGFYLDHYDQNVEITSADTAVLNVYYDRRTVTYTFHARTNNTWQNTNVSGRYGTTFADNDAQWPDERWWYDDYQGYGYNMSGSGTRTAFLDSFMPIEGNYTWDFYGFTPRNTNVTFHHLKQNPDGVTYTEVNTVTAYAQNTNNITYSISDKYDGYHAAAYSTNGTSWTDLPDEPGSDGYYGTVTGFTNLYIRYDPDLYDIAYENGTCYDGDDTMMTSVNASGELFVKEDIPYKSDISAYADEKPDEDYIVSDKYDFVFEGWYVDDTCTQPYNFESMPQGLVVYAKWRLVQYRVFLHPQADIPEGTEDHLDWGSSTQKMTFRISSGDRVDTPYGTRDNYEMVGWFYDPVGEEPFNDELIYLRDTTVPDTPAYDKDVDFTDPMDQRGNGATWNSDKYETEAAAQAGTPVRDRFWVQRKLDLYAVWRAELEGGAKGISVTYDAGEGSNAPTDDILYLDTARAAAKRASTPPTGGSDTLSFKYWVVQQWDGTQFVDVPDSVVYPGDHFSVLKDLAHKVEENGVTTYTMQLRAHYDLCEAPEETQITWFANNETLESDNNNQLAPDGPVKTKFRMNQAVYVKPSSTFSYVGHKFLGWAKIARVENRDGDYQLGYDPTDPNRTPLTEADIWLKYDAAGDYFVEYDNGAAVQINGEDKRVQYVAADEVGCDDLFAVWGESDGFTINYYTNDGTTVTKFIPEDEIPVDEQSGNFYYDLIDGSGKYDGVDPDYLYAGYQKEVTDPDTGNVTREYGTVNGHAIQPALGDVYWVKEVDASYLAPYFKYSYVGTANLYHNQCTSMVVVSSIDDLMYSAVGFIVDTDGTPYNKSSGVKKSLKFQPAGKAAVTMNASNTFGHPGYLTYVDVSTIIDFSSTFENVYDENSELVAVNYIPTVFNLYPYWKTLDGVTVFGKEGTEVTINVVDDDGNLTGPASRKNIAVPNDVLTFFDVPTS